HHRQCDLGSISPATQGLPLKGASTESNCQREVNKTRRPTAHHRPFRQYVRMEPMLTGDVVQKRNAFVACAVFRIEGLEAYLDRAREIAVRDDLDAVGHCIEEARRYLTQIRDLHREALEEFTTAQGE